MGLHPKVLILRSAAAFNAAGRVLRQVLRRGTSRAERSGGYGMGFGDVDGVQGCGWSGGELVCCCDERRCGWVDDVWDVVRRWRSVWKCGVEREE